MDSRHTQTNGFHLVLVIVLSFLLLSGCSSDDSESEVAKNEYLDFNLEIPDNRSDDRYRVLIFGNSHVAGLTGAIHELLKIGKPNADIYVYVVGGGFLDDKLTEAVRDRVLDEEPWTHIILQGQKYSQSNTINYSTLSAQLWIAKAKERGITPILFPEHPQKGNLREARQIHTIHKSIIAKQKSCIAPVGLAWDKVIIANSNLTLHEKDGNHASPLGKLLTALVFYETITGEPADLLPTSDSDIANEATQQLLKQLASETIVANQPCSYID